jgi:hypothetical protein
VGQLNNWKWPACFARTVCLRIGLSEPEIGLEHAFTLLIAMAKKHDKWQNSHGARFEKTTANCSNSFCHFHLISSVSQPQRPLIKYLELISKHI